jgi:hypothetical protein
MNIDSTESDDISTYDNLEESDNTNDGFVGKKSTKSTKSKKNKKVRSPTGFSDIFTPDSESPNIEELNNMEDLKYFLNSKLKKKEKYNGLLESTNGQIMRDPSCIRKYSNFSFPSGNSIYNLVDYYPDSNDFEEYNPTTVEEINQIIENKTTRNILNTYSPENLEIVSPKLNALIQKIRALDEKDMATYGKLFKHFIFTDNSPSMAGVKVVASSLIANGFKLAYGAETRFVNLKKNKKNNKKKFTLSSEPKDKENKNKLPTNAFENISLKTDEELLRTPYENFYMLSSKTVYGKPIPVSIRKEILKKFNSRPDNIGGALSRIIIMDGGFKEGIDLFDIKYVHIFEPTITKSDQTQVIGRGTRTCGQKGLDFHPTKGWPLYVYIYDLDLKQYPEFFSNTEESGIQVLLQAIGVNMQLLNFYTELESLAIVSAVDNRLNSKIHSFKASNLSSNTNIAGSKKKLKEPIFPRSTDMPPVREVLPNTWLVGSRHNGELTHEEIDNYVNRYLSQYVWDNLVMKNNCVNPSDITAPPNIPMSSPESEENQIIGGMASYDEAYNQQMVTLGPDNLINMNGGAGGEIMNFTPTQAFVSNYFTPGLPLKGMLLWHSVGTGKTCSAIATASSFEQEGYTILWVTRTTLKNDIWKNMFDQVCSLSIKEKIKNGLVMPNDMSARKRLLPKEWKIQPMSYKQFSNLVSKQNKMYEEMVKINGKEDPLRKTLIIIDEAHKLYGGGDLSSLEQPDMVSFHRSVMNSYSRSGLDSVRLLLMTATPIQKDPMELIKILNLTKTPDDQLPDTFDKFSSQYLNHEGKFTEFGVNEFMNQVAGRISYLNREKDARQFSQPVIKSVKVNVMPRNIQQKIKRGIIKQYKYHVDNVKKNITEKEKDLKNTKNDTEKLKNVEQHFLKRVCDTTYTGKAKTICRKKIKELTNEIKNSEKDKIELLKESIKNEKESLTFLKEQKDNDVKNALNSVDQDNIPYLKRITENKIGVPKGVLSQLAYKCTKRETSDKEFTNYLKEHSPDVAIFEESLKGLEQDIKNTEKLYSKEKDKTLKKQLRDEISAMKENYTTTKKNRGKMMKKALTALKRQTKMINTKYKKAETETKKAIKQLHKQEDFENSIEDIDINVQKYVDQIGNMQEELDERNKEELNKKKEKEKLKEEKKMEKEQEKLEKKKANEEAKFEKKKANEEAKLQKKKAKEEEKLEKERAKTEKARAKKAESSLNKTRKNKKNVN